ncbi:hypothetical protein AZ035_001535, partial [Klebsiella aerogenes]
MINYSSFDNRFWLFNVQIPVSYTHLDVYKRQVIGHGLGGDGAFHAFNDQVCGFKPLHVAQ